jgi:hypothetical protein
VSSPPRPAPTQQELIDGGNHLLYEVQMLHNTAALIRDHHRWQGVAGWENFTLYMATLESFLVHTRSLIDFLRLGPSDLRPHQRRGIFAFDFCTAWTPERWTGDLKAINKEILHLSYDRPEVGRNWKYEELLARLNRGIEDFLKDADQLHQHFHEELGRTLGGARWARAYTPAVAAGVPSISTLGEAAARSTGSVPTSAVIDRSVLVDFPSDDASAQAG